MEGELFPELQFKVHSLDEKQAKLFAKLAVIMGEIHAVAKEGRNDHFKYDYVREAEVLAEVRKALSKYKVACIPTVAWQEKVGNITKIALDITFVDGEGGGATTVRWYGEGQDTGDKGLYKSYTGCLKYAMLKTFLIPTDDDPEKPTDEDAIEAARERMRREEETEKRKANLKPLNKTQTAPATKADESDSNKPATDDQLKHLQALAKSKGLSGEAMKERIKVMFNKESSKNLTFHEACDLVNVLEAMEG